VHVGALLLYGLIAMIAVGLLFGLAVLVLPSGEQIAPPAPDIKPWALADRPLHAEDVVDVRLPVALRGYRFAETDLLLDRLTEELRARDEEIARLLGGAPDDPAPVPDSSVSEPSGQEPGSPLPDPSAPRDPSVGA
jgi:hypothetical protein